MEGRKVFKEYLKNNYTYNKNLVKPNGELFSRFNSSFE